MTTAPGTPLGAAIRRLRRERNLSQQELADKLGVTNNAISQFERGTTVPGVHSLAALAAALDVTYGVLFGEPFALAEHAVAQVRAEVRALGYDLALIPREEPDEVPPHLEPAPSAATIAGVLAIADAPYREGADLIPQEDA